jgi:multicomponent Na+:H+ antiporter subunit E
MKYVLWPWYLIVLVTAFAWDLTVSSLQVARVVLLPGDTVRPRFVLVPLTRVRSDLEIAVVANYISLTPGTLSVDVSEDRSTLLIHALMGGENGDTLRAEVRDELEPRVLRVLRP